MTLGFEAMSPATTGGQRLIAYHAPKTSGDCDAKVLLDMTSAQETDARAVQPNGTARPPPDSVPRRPATSTDARNPTALRSGHASASRRVQLPLPQERRQAVVCKC
jgi:hypothetical protein